MTSQFSYGPFEFLHHTGFASISKCNEVQLRRTPIDVLSRGMSTVFMPVTLARPMPLKSIKSTRTRFLVGTPHGIIFIIVYIR